MINRSKFLLLTLLLAAASLLAAKPNFSGEWKIDTAKSDFGDMPVPSEIVMQIEHSDPKLAMKQFQSGGPMGSMTADFVYMTDGTETKNKVRGTEIPSTAKWSGDALKITTKMSWQDNQVTIAETWKIAAGGRNLELLREMSSAQGTSTMKLVFAKSDKK